MPKESSPKLIWTEQHGEWLRRALKEKGVSVTIVAVKCDVHRATISRWCSGESAPCDEYAKAELAVLFDYRSFAELYQAINTAIGMSWSRPLDFETTARLLNEIDHEVVSFLMQRDAYDPDEITVFFSGGLEKKFSSRGRDCYDLLSLLHDETCRGELAASLPKAALTVAVDNEFREIRFAVASCPRTARVCSYPRS